MLVLTRKPGESIILETENGPVEIVVRQIRRNQVRIGLVADDEVRIWRREVYDKLPHVRDDSAAGAAE